MSVTTQAGELEDKISSLRNNYDALEGYWATDEAKTETGKSATFEQGSDFASGCPFARMELKDAKGAYYQARIRKSLHAFREHRWGK